MVLREAKFCIEKVSLNFRYFHEYFNDIFHSSGFFGETIVTPENSSSKLGRVTNGSDPPWTNTWVNRSIKQNAPFCAI